MKSICFIIMVALIFVMDVKATEPTLDDILNDINGKHMESKSDTDINSDSSRHYIIDESDSNVYDPSSIQIPLGFERYSIKYTGNIQLFLFSIDGDKNSEQTWKYMSTEYIGKGILLPGFSINDVVQYFTYRGNIHLLDNYISNFSYDTPLHLKLHKMNGDVVISMDSDTGERKIRYNLNINNISNMKTILWTDDKTTVLTPVSIGKTNYILLTKIN